MTPQSAKAKGRRLQQWVAQQISDLTGLECGADKPIESRPMGQHGVDIRLEKKALKLFPFSVECKFQEKWSMDAFLIQAKTNIIKNTAWLLVLKKSRQRPIIVIDAEIFFRILKNCNLTADVVKHDGNIKED